jgi:hypothetical protein
MRPLMHALDVPTSSGERCRRAEKGEASTAHNARFSAAFGRGRFAVHSSSSTMNASCGRIFTPSCGRQAL